MSSIFNQGALDANRRGRLTLSQAIGLLPLILIGGVSFLMGVGMLGWFFYSLIAHTLQESILGGVIFDGAISIVFFVIGYVISGKRLIDIINGRVSQVEGRGDKYQSRSVGSSEGGNLYFAVGNEKFFIRSYGTWKKLPGETMVRAYYTPLSKTLVNVESTTSQSGTAKMDLELEGLRMLEEMRKAKKQK